MKILHIINNLGSGGAEKLLKESLPLLNQEKDIKVELLLLTDNNNVFYDSIVEEGIKVSVIKYKNIYDPRNIIAIKKHIENGQYDIIHSHLFPTQYWVAIAKLILKNKKIRFITTEHSTHNRRREKAIFRPIDKFIYKQYDTIISITEKTKENLIKWIDSSKKNTNKHIIIENGVNVENIKKALPYKKGELLEEVSEDIKIICMVGRFSEAKDQQTLIKAIKSLPEDIHLVLVGEGPLMDKSKNLTKELGLNKRIHFLGFRQDIPRILKTIDIVVLSSHWEGFGLAAVEGMASGKPVIASDVEGLADIIKHKELLFQIGNSNMISKKILLLLNDREYYNDVSNYCKKRSERFDIKTHIKSIKNCYRKLELID